MQFLHEEETDKTKKEALFNFLTVLKLIEIKRSNASETNGNNDLNALVLNDEALKKNTWSKFLLRMGALTLCGAYETGNLMGLFGTAYGVSSTVATEVLPSALSYVFIVARYGFYAYQFTPEWAQKKFARAIHLTS